MGDETRQSSPRYPQTVACGVDTGSLGRCGTDAHSHSLTSRTSGVSSRSACSQFLSRGCRVTPRSCPGMTPAASSAFSRSWAHTRCTAWRLVYDLAMELIYWLACGLDLCRTRNNPHSGQRITMGARGGALQPLQNRRYPWHALIVRGRRHRGIPLDMRHLSANWDDGPRAEMHRGVPTDGTRPCVVAAFAEAFVW